MVSGVSSSRSTARSQSVRHRSVSPCLGQSWWSQLVWCGLVVLFCGCFVCHSPMMSSVMECCTCIASTHHALGFLFILCLSAKFTLVPSSLLCCCCYYYHVYVCMCVCAHNIYICGMCRYQKTTLQSWSLSSTVTLVLEMMLTSLGQHSKLFLPVEPSCEGSITFPILKTTTHTYHFLSLFVCMYGVRVCMCVFTCLGLHTCACMWRSEVNTECHPLSLSTLFF